MKLAWVTDIHLNFLKSDSRKKFYANILKTNLNVLLCSGDIAEATSVVGILNEMASELQKPIYFVLGNHDYYGGQVTEVRNKMILLTEDNPLLNWLPVSGPHFLAGVCLLGQDGWADGRLGDYQKSHVSLNDSLMIADLFEEKIVGKHQLLSKMQQLADIDAEKLAANFKEVIKENPNKIIVLTHVPPFKEACMYQGKISSDDFLPYFGSKVMGDVLLQVASENPGIDFLVLCGHTHNNSIYQPIDNLVVKVGEAEYYFPEVIETLEV